MEEPVGPTWLRPPWGDIGRSLTLGIVSTFAKLVLNVVNNTKIVNHEAFLKAVSEREPGVGLLTVANHTSLFDDPGLVCAMLPWQHFWFEPWISTPMRWSICAKEVCFKNELLKQFFRNGKVLPVERGKGVLQPVVDLMSEQLGKGAWVHVFPEGRINYGGQLGRLRWGIGRMICESKQQSGGRDPIVLPFYHSGMGYVLPMSASFFRAAQEVTVVVGDPLDLSDITCRCNKPGEDQRAVWSELTARVRTALTKLEEQAPPNPEQPECPDCSTS